MSPRAASSLLPAPARAPAACSGHEGQGTARHLPGGRPPPGSALRAGRIFFSESFWTCRLSPLRHMRGGGGASPLPVRLGRGAGSWNGGERWEAGGAARWSSLQALGIKPCELSEWKSNLIDGQTGISASQGRNAVPENTGRAVIQPGNFSASHFIVRAAIPPALCASLPSYWGPRPRKWMRGFWGGTLKKNFLLEDAIEMQGGSSLLSTGKLCHCWLKCFKCGCSPLPPAENVFKRAVSGRNSCLHDVYENKKF